MIYKEAFLKIFTDKEIGNKIYNKLNEAIEYNIPTYIDIFVTPNIWKKLGNKYEDIEIKSVGYDRKQIYFIPPLYEIEYDITILKISINNKFREYKHSDFLGSIMSLNIDRLKIGDVFVENNEAYFMTSSNIAKYICDNLVEIGKNKCNISIVDNIPITYKYENIKINTSSLRIDSIVKNICNISRNKAIEYIETGKVLVDYEETKDKSKTISKEEIITIKKYGKYILNDYTINKKGRYSIELKKYK